MTFGEAKSIVEKELNSYKENPRLTIDPVYIEALNFIIHIGQCKNCKYFEYDSFAKVDGIPLIVAHEICSKWGNGCKTREDGYCFLFEQKEDH